MKILRFKIAGLPGILIVLISFWSCARIVSPVGGPKDVTPPKVVKCVPPNFSTNFKRNQFAITFDEFVKVDKFSQEVLISPPVEKFPDYKIKKKTLIVHLKDTLKPNTTYTVNFGQSISDITEGNILNNFSYIFSTGTHVDSLSLRGQVLNALEKTPEKDITVMLYKNNNDTLPLKSLPLYVKPYYVSKTNKNGEFMFSGLADTSYLLFALKDMDYSLTYNLANEEIAFSDSMVRPQYRPAPVFDSALFKKLVNPKMEEDSVLLVADSLNKMADSLASQKIREHTLYLFQPADTVPKLLKVSLISKNTMQFAFNFPADTVKIFSKNYAPKEQWFKPEWNAGKDTLTWFLKQPHPDSLKLLMMNGKDTLGFQSIAIIQKEKYLPKRKKHEPIKVEYLNWKYNMISVIKPGQKLELTFDQPVNQLRFDSVLMIKDKDSIYNPPHYFADSVHRTLVFPFKVEPDKKYRLNIPDSAVIDWNGYYNKAIMITLQSKKTKEYGVLRFMLNPQKKNQHYIFQLLTPKNKVVESRYFSSAKEIVIENIDPGTYGFRIIFDRNNNKEWDPGNYLHDMEPEKVISYPKKVEVRANWEIDENWSF